LRGREILPIQIFLREEDAVAFVPYLSVVDDSRGRVRDELETVPGAFRCSRSNRDGDGPNLKEVSGKLVRSVMDTEEALYNATQLEIDRVDSPARESERPVAAEAVWHSEGIKHTDVLSMEFASARCQVHADAA